MQCINNFICVGNGIVACSVRNGTYQNLTVLYFLIRVDSVAYPYFLFSLC